MHRLINAEGVSVFSSSPRPAWRVQSFQGRLSWFPQLRLMRVRLGRESSYATPHKGNEPQSDNPSVSQNLNVCNVADSHSGFEWAPLAGLQTFRKRR
jgi:hypothetical protein